MRVYRQPYRDERGRLRACSRWYLEFRDHNRVARRMPALIDREASVQLGRKIEKLAAWRAAGESPSHEFRRWLEGLPEDIRDRLLGIGLLEPSVAVASRRLTELVEEFGESLKARGRTRKHVAHSVARILRLFDRAGCVFWTHVQASRIEAALRDLREQGYKIPKNTRSKAKADAADEDKEERLWPSPGSVDTRLGNSGQ